MNEPMSRWRGYRAGPVVALGALMISGSVVGCSGDDNSPNTQPVTDSGTDTSSDTSVADAHGDTATGDADGGDAADTTVPDTLADGAETGPLGDGTLGTATKVTLGALSGGQSLGTLFDAVPDATGAHVYATGYASGQAGVFSIVASSGAPTSLYAGSALELPLGIALSADGATLYIADPSVASSSADRGGLFSLPVAGGTPALVAGTAGLAPTGVHVSGTTVYFTSISGKGTGSIYSMTTGSPTAVTVTGVTLIEPSAITSTSDGTLYVLDSAGGSGRTGAIIKIASGGAATVLVNSLWVGLPGGLDVSQDGSALLLASLAGSGETDVVARIAFGGATTPQGGTTFAALKEPGGLHRASGADVYSFVDSTTTGASALYILSK